MLDLNEIEKFRNGVCSVGLLPVPLKKYLKNPNTFPFEIFGTGFLIADNLVITAAHVLEELSIEQGFNNGIPDNQRFVDFTHASGIDQIHTTLRMIRNPRRIPDTSLDIAMIEVQPEPSQHFANIPPLEIQDSLDFQVMEKVYAVGFAHANFLLDRENGPHRYGPVIQQGFISAVSPHEMATRPTEILLDLQAAHGMSGSPIILERTGQVIAILYQITKEMNFMRQQIRTTTAFGLLITREDVDLWISDKQ